MEKGMILVAALALIISGGALLDAYGTELPGRDAGTSISRASTLVGTDVRNLGGEHLGKVTDFLIDPLGGRIVFAVVAPGGIAGLSDRVYAVPFSALGYDAGRSRFLLDISRERLIAAPSFDRRSWSGVMDRSWSESVYRYYGQQPYWAGIAEPLRPMRDFTSEQGSKTAADRIMRNFPGGGMPSDYLMDDRIQRERQH